MASLINKVKDAVSHNSSSNTTSNQSTGQKVANEASTAAHNHSSTTGTNNGAHVGPTGTHGVDSTITDRNGAANSNRTGTTGQKIENAVENKVEQHQAQSHASHGTTGEHLREHAHPPHHTHNQPERDGLLTETDAKLATHDHQHLAPVTHETRVHHEVEEVERQREVDRHVHHVQHHVQPVLDTQHAAEVHRENVVPTQHIRENHVVTDEDKANFAALNNVRDEVKDAGREKTIIDRGEQVHENVHHAVHHVVQPVIERDTHEHTKVHTVIPVKQTTHEAPIIHQSTVHEPLRIDEFVAGGGDLKSKLHHDANLLNVNGEDCSREVDADGSHRSHNHPHGHPHHVHSEGEANIANSGAVGTTGSRV